MKPTPSGTPLALFAAAALTIVLSPPASGQLTVYSDVAGFDTIQVNPASASGSKMTFASLPFIRDSKYLGSATALDANRQVVSVAGASWAPDAFSGAAGSHYLEVTSVGGSKTAAQVGATRSILGNATGELQLAWALPEGLAVPFEFRVVRHWTLASLFGGSNSVGLRSGSVRSADHVQLWNGSGYDSYFYQTAGIGGTGWRRVGDQSTDASATVIRPDQNVIIKRVATGSLPVLVSGWVKNGQSAHGVVPGFNFVPNPFALPVTLAASGLYSGNPSSGLVGGTINSADQVLLWNGTAYDTYYYQTSGVGGSGWRRVGSQNTDASGALIRPGFAVILRRKAANGFTWNIPQP